MKFDEDSLPVCLGDATNLCQPVLSQLAAKLLHGFSNGCDNMRLLAGTRSGPAGLNTNTSPCMKLFEVKRLQF